MNDRKLSPLEEIRLERLRKDLGLSEAEASQIFAEEQEPIRKAKDEYEAMLIGLIEAEHYPFDVATQAELQTARQELGLTDEEVEAIAPQILAAAEEEYQQAKVIQQQSSENRQQKQPSSCTASLPSKELAIPGANSDAEAARQVDVDYSKLRELLIAERWQDADQETFKVMLKIVGSTKNWISDCGIATFPREDLHMIDQLWNQSSSGLFGFSIQKRVWLSVGGKAEKPDFKVYEHFGERLGWRANSKWLNYESLTFSLDALEGHLPICGYETDGSWMRWYWALFSRRDW